MYLSLLSSASVTAEENEALKYLHYILKQLHRLASSVTVGQNYLLNAPTNLLDDFTKVCVVEEGDLKSSCKRYFM